MFNKQKSAVETAKEIIGKGVTPLVETQIPDKKLEHKHEWELLSKTYAPSRQDISEIKMTDKEMIDRMLFGVTVFLWECLVCRELRKELVLGSDTTQLDELIDKADKYGPQYIQRTDGITFVLTKFNQGQQGQIPMR